MFNLWGWGGENEVDNSWDLNLVLLNFCFERISIIHCFLSIQKMDHWVNLKGKEDMGGNGWGHGINLLKKNVWSAGRRGWKPLMLTAGNFLTSVWLTTLMLQWGASVQPCSGILCLWVVVLIMWQLERLIVDKQQDYEEGFTGLKGTVVGRPLICQPKRKLVRADWSRLKKGRGRGKMEKWEKGSI